MINPNMRRYLKPETEVVLLTAAQAVMQVMETSPGTAPVGGGDTPEEPTLSNQNSVWDLWEDVEKGDEE